MSTRNTLIQECFLRLPLGEAVSQRLTDEGKSSLSLPDLSSHTHSESFPKSHYWVFESQPDRGCSGSLPCVYHILNYHLESAAIHPAPQPVLLCDSKSQWYSCQSLFDDWIAPGISWGSHTKDGVLPLSYFDVSSGRSWLSFHFLAVSYALIPHGVPSLHLKVYRFAPGRPFPWQLYQIGSLRKYANTLFRYIAIASCIISKHLDHFLICLDYISLPNLANKGFP